MDIKEEIKKINNSFPTFYFLPSVIKEENNDIVKLENEHLKIKKRTLPSGLVIFTVILSMVISLTSFFEIVSIDYHKPGLFIFLTFAFCLSYYRAKKVQFLLKQKILLIKKIDSSH